MKKVLSILALTIAFVTSCKKNESSSEIKLEEKVSLQKLKEAFSISIKTQLDSSKLFVAQVINRATLKKSTSLTDSIAVSEAYQTIVYIDFAPYRDYCKKRFNMDLPSSIFSSSRLKVNVVNPNPTTPPTVVGITGDSYPEHATDNFNIFNAANTLSSNIPAITEGLSYQDQYIAITRNYQTLSSYTTQLNNLEDNIFASQISSDQKNSLIYQIEYLKAYAADLENNLSYYEDIASGNTQAVAYVKDNNAFKDSKLKVNKKRGCSVNVGDVLMGGIVSGFWGERPVL